MSFHSRTIGPEVIMDHLETEGLTPPECVASGPSLSLCPDLYKASILMYLTCDFHKLSSLIFVKEPRKSLKV